MICCLLLMKKSSLKIQFFNQILLSNGSSCPVLGTSFSLIWGKMPQHTWKETFNFYSKKKPELYKKHQQYLYLSGICRLDLDISHCLKHSWDQKPVLTLCTIFVCLFLITIIINPHFACSVIRDWLWSCANHQWLYHEKIIIGSKYVSAALIAKMTVTVMPRSPLVTFATCWIILVAMIWPGFWTLVKPISSTFQILLAE